MITKYLNYVDKTEIMQAYRQAAFLRWRASNYYYLRTIPRKSPKNGKLFHSFALHYIIRW